MKKLLLCTTATLMLFPGCSVVGKESAEIAPYNIVQSTENSAIEIRHYEQMILVSAPMVENGDENRNSAFRSLFRYISGDNVNQSEIAMTAPVFMDPKIEEKPSGTQIPMTAPVFMDNKNDKGAVMSFVMPDSFTLETTPIPTDPNVTIEEIKDYKVAAITFNGRLSEDNINTHKEILTQWIKKNGYTQTGSYKTAGYNPPFTLPAFRRNEILIPIKK